MTLPDLAKSIAASKMAEPQKVRVLLAIVRVMSSLPRRPVIESIGDVDRLLLIEPEEYGRLLRAYWLLLGARGPAA